MVGGKRLGPILIAFGASREDTAVPRYGAGCGLRHLKELSLARAHTCPQHRGSDAPPTSVPAPKQVQQAMDLVSAGEVLGEEVRWVFVSPDFAQLN